MLSAVQGPSGPNAEQHSVDPPPVSDIEAGELIGSSPELVLLCLQNQAYAAQCSSTRSEIDRAADELSRLRDLIRKAREAAERAREQSGVFGGIASALGSDLAPILGAVGSAALIVGSGGTATPLVVAAAGLALSARTAQALELDPRLCAALGLAAAGSGLLAGNTAGVGTGYGAVAGVAQAGAGAATSGSGVCAAIAGHHAARAGDALAEIQELGSAEQTVADREHDAVLALGSATEQLGRAVDVVSDLRQERHQALSAIAGAVR